MWQRLIGASAVAALLAVVVPASPAVAHARLVGSTPAADSTVNDVLTEVKLSFSGAVDGQFTTVVVTAPDGAAYGDGAARTVDATVSKPVKPLPAGLIRVAYRTVAADGHPLQGQFTFTNATGRPVSPVAAAARPRDTAGVPRWPLAALALVGVAGGAWWLRRRLAQPA